jgi:Peptidase family M28
MHDLVASHGDPRVVFLECKPRLFNASPAPATGARRCRGAAQVTSLVALVALVALVLAGALVRARVAPPEARGVDAPLGEVSGGRAVRTLERLLAGGAPHPVESAANHLLRGRLVGELRALGLDPEVHVGRACTPSGNCAVVHNVVARIAPSRAETAPAPDGPRTILLLAHFDSVAAGPGAGDDGAATAALIEVARVLHDAPPKRNPVLLVWDDGEEAGLLGARAFVESDPLAREVAVVLNFEARGTSGASLMFETSEDDAWLVEVFARVAPRPVTGSLFPAVYEVLPNYTDFRSFKDKRTPGMNFAFIGDAQNYHTPSDDLAHLDPRSVQHHADNAFAMARALGDDEPAARPRKGRAVFFDILGLTIVRWPATWAVPLAAIVALALVLALVRRRRPIASGLAALLLPQAAAGVVLVACVLARATGLHPAQWTAASGPYLALAWAVPILLLAPFVRHLRKRTCRHAAWAAVHASFALLGVVVAILLPGGSYVFVAPATIAAGSAIVLGLVPERCRSAALSTSVIVTAVVAAVVWFPLALLLYAALGLFALPGVAAIVGFVASTLLPAFLPLERPARAGPIGQGLAQKTHGG